MKALQKRFIVLIIGIAILLLSFLIPWDMFLPPWNVAQGSSWHISPGVIGTVQIGLFWGSVVHGKIWCYGANNDIDFRIKNSGNRVVFNPGRIYNGYEFRWQAWSNDIYQFEFDNTISWVTTKDVGYLIYSYYYFHAFLLVGTILIVVGFFLILKEGIKTKPREARFFCRYCGTENIQGTIYCKRCGKKIGKEPSEN